MDGVLDGDFGARFIASEVDGQTQRRAADGRVGRVYQEQGELLEHLAARRAAAGPRHGFRGRFSVVVATVARLFLDQVKALALRFKMRDARRDLRFGSCDLRGHLVTSEAASGSCTKPKSQKRRSKDERASGM